ncbi:unnamed protein product [Brachionus calyciflorus]|uniref:Uncharacterized protein n=1 Tax=Brachionus calyciflorus TaxID=104777 RepID=A0A813NJV3_9BILA|nr:unnamed protein product [Brachionus calyciflorus]
MKNESYKIEKFRLYNLSHVIIPFHIKQLKSLTENIKKWSVYRPCFEDDYFNRKMPKLIFYVGYTNDETIKNLYYKLGDLLPYFRCFSNRYSIDIVKFKFSKKRDKHIVGARLMFEHVLAKKHYLFKHASYVFYMEPDCRPIRSGWIDALQKEIGFNGFWIKGAMFRGKFEMKINKYLPNKYHINGNAIYNIGDRKFEDFYFKKLRPYIQRHNDSITAYDTDFFEYLFDLKNYDTVRMIVQNFAFTETIQNLWLTNYSVKEIRKKYPKTFLVHGGQQNGA